MSTGAACVQASYMKNSVASLARSGAPGAAVFRADPELFQQIDAAWRIAWLPVSYNVRFVEAVARGVGWPRGIELLATGLFEQFDTPLWKALIQGGVRLLGLEPTALVRWLPSAVSLVFRNCGSWSVQRLGPQRAEIRAEELPKELADSRRWLESMGAGAGAIGLLCGVCARSELVQHDPHAATARWFFEWDPVAQGDAGARRAA